MALIILPFGRGILLCPIVIIKAQKRKRGQISPPSLPLKKGGKVVVVFATIKEDVGSCSQRNSFHLPSNEEFMSLKVASFISFGLAV